MAKVILKNPKIKDDAFKKGNFDKVFYYEYKPKLNLEKRH
jgi:hypothetical protein